MEGHAQLQEEFSALKRSTSQIINEQKVHLLDMTRQAGQFEEEVKQFKELLEERDQMVSILRSELDGKDASATLELPPEMSVEKDTQGWKIIQDELHRQTSYIQKIDVENLRLKAEVVTMKDRHESIQVLREENRQLENRLKRMDDLRHRVIELEGDNDRLRGQLSSLSDVNAENAVGDILNDLEALRFKNVHLEDILGTTRAESIVLNNELTQCRVELTNAQQRVKVLEADIEQLKTQSARLKRRAEVAQGEIKFWRSAAELGKGQHQPGSEDGVDIAEQAKQMVESLKQEHESLLDEISRLGGGVERHGRSWMDLSKSLNDETRRRNQAEEGMLNSFILPFRCVKCP